MVGAVSLADCLMTDTHLGRSAMLVTPHGAPTLVQSSSHW